MKRAFKIFMFTLSILAFLLSLPELFHKNKGDSISSGTRANGKIENSHLIPYFGKNFRYFSPLSYLIMNNAYTHSKVCQTVLDTYKILYKENPDNFFYIMECSDKNGGKLSLHNTHQNGMSIDFMSPKKSKRYHPQWSGLGILHYLLEFNDDGILNFDKSVEIDFDLMAKHILVLHSAAKTNGIKIQRVILKIELKDDLFKSAYGKELKSSGIYFAQALPKWTNKMHDDHYHIDFQLK